jgi:hypothetical protein
MTFEDGHGRLEMLGGFIPLKDVTCSKHKNPDSGSVNLTFSIRGSVGIETRTQEGAIWSGGSLITGLIPQAKASGDAFKLYKCDN